MSDNQNNSSLPSASRPSAVNPTVEALLPYLFTSLPFMETVMTLSRPPTNIPNPTAEKYLAKVQTEREKLLLRPESELLPILQRYRAKEQAQREAAAAAKKEKHAAKSAGIEAALFYNQPSASADFDYWLKAEYWTFDEAVALLLGKAPTVVTWAAVKRELEAKSGFMLFEKPKPASGFLLTYQRLRNLALRAQAMTRTTKLRPTDAIAWAQNSHATEVPPQLIQLLAPPSPEKTDTAWPANAGEAAITARTASAESQAMPQQDRAPTAPSKSTLKKSALVKKYERVWMTIESDLGHANENGFSKAAKASVYGQWCEEEALAWARQNGKIVESVAPPAASMASLPRKIHLMGD
ncbi:MULTISPECIES: hypothetical protein [unclassified Polaromonas]|uniref:hypothetical protein n=1 Tax=unclassified Polaromonas TaxID=2638319 RepID=UPI0018C90A0D|nr:MULTISPECIES: hypothetical protein [unclassified Polaromonas]MBG6070261.1 hypothetical protein [Polaromonas sp. CG_9.7]MBG6112259.1 hypothetical protein [Polaromonas sp. CG_9.2]